MEIDIAGRNRARYMEHTPAYAPTAREDKGMLDVGVWATVGWCGRLTRDDPRSAARLQGLLID